MYLERPMVFMVLLFGGEIYEKYFNCFENIDP